MPSGRHADAKMYFRSVIIWKDFKRVIKIEAHEQAVWAIRFVGEDRLLTGAIRLTFDNDLANAVIHVAASADKKIILHTLDVRKGTTHQLQEYSGHSEPVRGLSLKTDGQGFWSCGNDGSVLIRRLEPLPLLLYSLSMLSQLDEVNLSEIVLRFARLLNVYSFDRPAPNQSLSGHTSFVYSVAALPDGSGAISSGEDGTLRVWSGK